MRLAPLMVVLALLLLTAAPALAGTARLETGQDGSATTARVVYRDAPGGRGAAIRLLPGGDRFEVSPPTVEDSAAGVTPGPGCELLFARSVACPVPPGVLPRGPVVYAGDEADEITVVVPATGTVIYGGTGSDYLIAAPRGGPEGRFGVGMHGGPGDDRLEATGTLRGGTGDDSFDVGVEGSSRIFGGPGRDVIDASQHADTVVPGPGPDLVYSNGGADVIRSRDGVTDIIDCGEGRDIAVVDVFDTTDFTLTDRVFEGCERLRRRGQPRAVPVGFQSWEGEPDVYLWVGCPPDGPERCLGDATLYRQGRAISRSSLRMRAGEHDVVLFRLGSRRIRGLLGRRIRVVLRTIDRSGRFHKATLVDSLEKPEPTASPSWE